MTFSRIVSGLDRLVALIISLGRFLALPVVALLFLPAPVWPSDSIWRERMAADLREWPHGKPKDLSRYNSQSQ